MWVTGMARASQSTASKVEVAVLCGDKTYGLCMRCTSHYAQELCGLQKSYMESHRLYLGRVHQQMRPGLGVQMFQNHSCERRSTVFEFKKYMQNTRAAKPLRKIGWKARSNGYMGWIAQIGNHGVKNGLDSPICVSTCRST